MPRPILEYSSRIHACRWLNAQGYWGISRPSLSFNKHSQYVAERVSNRNIILLALEGTSWGQQKEILLMTYKAVGISIMNYATPVWSPSLNDTNYRKNQIYTERGSEDRHWLLHDVEYRSPTHRSRDAES